MSKDKKAEVVKEVQESKNEEVKAEVITTSRGETFTKEEWTSPVVEDGPTRQEVEEWKDKHGNIYFTPFEGSIYIWRTLSRAEYREVATDETLSMYDKEEAFTDKCVLFPRNYETAKVSKGNAGVPSVLADYIMEKSGFVAQTAPIRL